MTPAVTLAFEHRGPEGPADVLGDLSRDGEMISAIVLVRGGVWRGDPRDPELLVRSLVWLVSAVVAGIVRDVTLAGPAGLGLADIADQSGCAVIEDDSEAARLTKAVALSKESRILILEMAYQPGDGMTGELDSFMRSTALSSEAVRLYAAPSTFLQRLFPALAPTVGVLAPASRCRPLKDRDFPRLAAGLRPKAAFATRAHPIF